MAQDTGLNYNDPVGGADSSIGVQTRTDYYYKKALVDIAKEMYFQPLANVRAMPKNMGKKIKQYHYLPLLDDANVNDQGIDAAGLIADGTVGKYKVTIEITRGEENSTGNGYVTRYAVGEDVVAATALLNAEAAANSIFVEYGVFTVDFATTSAAVTALTPAWTVLVGAALPNTGNLYGSSKDVGTISGKLPLLSENGGRVNRVGFKRIDIEADITKLGFFDEYTQESIDFDSDSELEMHIVNETLKGANEITEDALQIDLLNAAGVLRFAGDATATSEITGENGAVISTPTGEDLLRLSIDLDDNRTPKKTTIIAGSRMVDTRVIDAARIMYIGSELIPTIRRMLDLHGNPAFIEVQRYASAGNVMRGEIGTVDQFRIIVVPEMMHWSGVGATVTTNDGYRATSGKYDVFPMLVVGDASFTTIGFQTDGKSVKFKIKHVKPGTETSYGAHDPFGETGFYSIKWYYGTMILRPERIALIKCVAEL